MNNSRYAQTWFLRTAGIAGVLSSLVLLVNTAEHAGLIPETDVTQLAAPLAQLAAIVLVLGLLARLGPPSGFRLGVTTANIVVLAGFVGVAFVNNLVFAQVDPATIDALLAGPLSITFVVVSVSFLIATILLVLAYWRAAPRWALLVYGLGTIPVSLRAFVPDVALEAGLVAMAVGIGGLALSLLTAQVKDQSPR